jgi:hypothetical protein
MVIGKKSISLMLDDPKFEVSNLAAAGSIGLKKIN